METARVSQQKLRRASGLWKAIFHPAEWPIFSAFNTSDSSVFRVRDPERDKNTNRDRTRRLIGLLEQLGREIKSERDGLAARLKADAGDAAFLMEALENGDADEREMKRIDTLEQAIVDAEVRIKTLDNNMEKMETLAAAVAPIVPPSAVENLKSQ